jgi:hypothetical protein
MSTPPDNPATRRDLDEAISQMESRMERFVLKREIGMLWKVIALQVTLIGAIAAGNWAAFFFVTQHLVWKAS